MNDLCSWPQDIDGKVCFELAVPPSAYCDTHTWRIYAILKSMPLPHTDMTEPDYSGRHQQKEQGS